MSSPTLIGDTAQQLFLASGVPSLIVNTGSFPVYLASHDAVSVTDNEFVLNPGASLMWANATRIFAVTETGLASSIQTFPESVFVGDPYAVGVNVAQQSFRQQMIPYDENMTIYDGLGNTYPNMVWPSIGYSFRFPIPRGYKTLHISRANLYNNYNVAGVFTGHAVSVGFYDTIDAAFIGIQTLPRQYPGEGRGNAWVIRGTNPADLNFGPIFDQHIEIPVSGSYVGVSFSPLGNAFGYTKPPGDFGGVDWPQFMVSNEPVGWRGRLFEGSLDLSQQTPYYVDTGVGTGIYSQIDTIQYDIISAALAGNTSLRIPFRYPSIVHYGGLTSHSIAGTGPVAIVPYQENLGGGAGLVHPVEGTSLFSTATGNQFFSGSFNHPPFPVTLVYFPGAGNGNHTLRLTVSYEMEDKF